MGLFHHFAHFHPVLRCRPVAMTLGGGLLYLLCMFQIQLHIEALGKILAEHPSQSGGNGALTTGMGKLHCRFAVRVRSNLYFIMDHALEVLKQVFDRYAVGQLTAFDKITPALFPQFLTGGKLNL